MREGDLFSDVDRPDAGRPLTISELTAGIKALVETGFGQVTVLGEISNCRKWTSGHLYFTLKDEFSQIRAVMFRTTARLLKFQPEDGQRVIARGRLSVYEVKGEYQIVCDALEPHGLGARQAAFDELKRRLQAEGLFDAQRKRPLPLLPRGIGVVTSANGAALRDVLRVLTVRHPSARIVIRASRVQGEGAAEDLARGLRALAAVPGVEVIIIGRGGGSAEDLWAFNDEGLARAIARCPVPVISAVGHEVDFTIADFVADVRAATPSNAAEIVVERADHVYARIDRAERRLRAVVELALARRRQRADRGDGHLRRWPTSVVLRHRDAEQLALRLRHAARARITRLGQRVDTWQARLDRQDVHRGLARWRARAAAAEGALRLAASRRRLEAAARAGTLAARLDALSPLAVLGRGYAICWNETRTGIIRSSRAVEAGDAVHVRLADGEIDCRVE